MKHEMDFAVRSYTIFWNICKSNIIYTSHIWSLFELEYSTLVLRLWIKKRSMKIVHHMECKVVVAVVDPWFLNFKTLRFTRIVCYPSMWANQIEIRVNMLCSKLKE